jgi:hypothetical protein
MSHTKTIQFVVKGSFLDDDLNGLQLEQTGMHTTMSVLTNCLYTLKTAITNMSQQMKCGHIWTFCYDRNRQASIFSFFSLSHSRRGGVRLVLQCERLKIYQYFTTVGSWVHFWNSMKRLTLGRQACRISGWSKTAKCVCIKRIFCRCMWCHTFLLLFHLWWVPSFVMCRKTLQRFIQSKRVEMGRGKNTIH